jgi:phage FluMu gp28-like protein
MSEKTSKDKRAPAAPTRRAPLAHQRPIYDDPARFRVIACGRRWGKTELGKLTAIEAASANQTVWWVSPSYAMSADVWRALKGDLHDDWEEKNEDLRQILLPGGGSIRVRSGDAPDSLRGASLDLAVLDEAAFLDQQVWTAAIRPSLSDRRGRALFLSTPRGVGNWFFTVYSYGQDATRPEWKAWRAPTADNPLIAPDEIEAARRDLPDRVFRAEYLAEFLEDGGGVFRGIREAATAPLDATWLAGHHYVLGIDWGRSADYTVGVVLDATEPGAAAMVAIDRFSGIGWDLQRGRLRALVDAWAPATIYAESNSFGGPNIEALQLEGLPIIAFNTTQASKEAAINSLSLALERGQLRIQPDPTLLHELSAYTLEPLDSGRYRYGAPSGVHDDTVIALALAWVAAQRGAVRVQFG